MKTIQKGFIGTEHYNLTQGGKRVHSLLDSTSERDTYLVTYAYNGKINTLIEYTQKRTVDGVEFAHVYPMQSEWKASNYKRATCKAILNQHLEQLALLKA